jgi:low temperature requirement protein LtrA
VTKRRGFQRWWQPPRRATDRPEGRRVSFLELFFDLVFVVVVARLSHVLASDPSWSGVGRFAFLFLAVWSAWINGTYYHDLHGTNDVSIRVFTFAQMLAIAGMAIYIDDATGNGGEGFAVAYAVHHAVLTVMWFRTGVHDPAHRPASVPYSLLYGSSALVFAVSALVPGPLRLWMWGAALACEFVAPVTFGRLVPDVTEVRTVGLSGSVVERFGLLVIIVLGEVVVGAINGVAEHEPLDAGIVATGGLGMLLAIGLWWIYFDLVSHRRPKPAFSVLWTNVHFIVVVGIAASGAAVFNTIEHANEPLSDNVRWLLLGAVATALVGIAWLMSMLEARDEHPAIYRAGMSAVLISAGVAILCGFTDLGVHKILLAVAVLLLAPVVYGVVLWVKLYEGREFEAR